MGFLDKLRMGFWNKLAPGTMGYNLIWTFVSAVGALNVYHDLTYAAEKERLLKPLSAYIERYNPIDPQSTFEFADRDLGFLVSEYPNETYRPAYELAVQVGREMRHLAQMTELSPAELTDRYTQINENTKQQIDAYLENNNPWKSRFFYLDLANCVLPGILAIGGWSSLVVRHLRRKGQDSPSQLIYAGDQGEIFLPDGRVLEYKLSPRGKNYGLMVGCDGAFSLNPLEGTTNDVFKLKKEFGRRGFRGNIETLVNGQATPKNVLTKLEELKPHSTSDSMFLFYYSGHGDPKGRLKLEDSDLPVEAVFDALSNYSGQKLVVFDSCETLAAVEKKQIPLPPRTVVVGSRRNAWEGQIPEMASGETYVVEGQPPLMGYCTRAIYEILKKAPGEIPISDLVSELEKDPRLQIRYQDVGAVQGTSIILEKPE